MIATLRSLFLVGAVTAASAAGAEATRSILSFDELDGWAADDHSAARLEVYDGRESEGVSVAGNFLPLQTDISTPLAWFLTDPRKSLLDTFAFLRVDKAQELEGLYMVQPYDPNRIPVLMVHGIWSSPVTWMEMFNDLQSDPVLREKYQFWFYLYPTGQPLTFAAAGLLFAASPPATADERSASDHVLNAEVALHGGDYLTAVREYRQAAELSDSVSPSRVPASM